MVENCSQCKCSESIIRFQYPINSSGILPGLFDDTRDDDDGFESDDDGDDFKDDNENSHIIYYIIYYIILKEWLISNVRSFQNLLIGLTPMMMVWMMRIMMMLMMTRMMTLTRGLGYYRRSIIHFEHPVDRGDLKMSHRMST